MGRRVLVTGANGLLGRACVARLVARGDRVTGVVRSGDAPVGADTLRLDLAGDLSPALSAISAPDAIVHLAQEPGWRAFPANSGRIAQVAVGAAAQLLEYAAGAGVRRFVYASSGGVYGPAAGPLREDAPLSPAGEVGFYLAAKAAGDALVRAFVPAPFTTAVLRYFFIYGPGQRTEFLLPRLIGAVRTGAPIRVAQGMGPRLNPVFVDDAADATLAALDQPTPAVLNVAGPETLPLRRMVEIMGELTGLAPVLEETPEAPQDFVADTSAIAALWMPRVGMEAGLRKMIKA